MNVKSKLGAFALFVTAAACSSTSSSDPTTMPDGGGDAAACESPVVATTGETCSIAGQKCPTEDNGDLTCTGGIWMQAIPNPAGCPQKQAGLCGQPCLPIGLLCNYPASVGGTLLSCEPAAADAGEDAMGAKSDAGVVDAAASIPLCDGDHTLVSSGGTKIDCSPYKCNATTCKMLCSSTADCEGSNTCDTESAACVAPPMAPSTPPSAAGQWACAASI